MVITINRIAKKELYTIGRMYIDGVYICDTLEDTDRGLSDNMKESEILNKKVYSKTAIPTGVYKVSLSTSSPKFKDNSFYRKVCGGNLPRLLNVKGFDGILIHAGNTAKDSAGCILIGQNKIVGKVINSRDTFKKVYNILKEGTTKGEKITIKIS